jgi:DnaJ-class molecular chaperone
MNPQDENRKYLPERCPVCKGRGLVNWEKEVCATCDGTGVIVIDQRTGEVVVRSNHENTNNTH